MTRRMRGLTLVVSFLIGACTGGAPADVPLALLVAQQEEYDGQTVTTHGTVVAVRDSEAADPYFVLQDRADNRVQLLPAAAAAPHEGDAVAVRGVFRFRPESGRELTVEDIVAGR